METLQKKWLGQIGKNGPLAFHVGPKSDQNALNALLQEKIL